ncbi:MAG: MATE family efflux transporter [Zoogloeaceae bacterium]|nr:MATE family efflux transporter [Zoogloeaceae bacterium]
MSFFRFLPLARRILGLAWPVLIAQTIAVGMMVVDTLVVGHFSTAHLAAVAVASGLYVTLALALGGVLQALAPIVGQHYGAGKYLRIASDIRQGLWLALFLALGGLALLLGATRALLALARLPPDVEAIAVTYLRVLALALPAMLGYRAFHAVATALGHPHPLMTIACLETGLHAVLAWLLVGGHLPGLPPLGAVGAAISQVVVTYVSLLWGVRLLLKDRRFTPFGFFAQWERPQAQAQKALLRLGLPMGISSLVEISAFTLMAIFVARLGAEAVSGHRIAANVSAFVYMLPLSLAIATATCVAQAVGARREKLAWGAGCAGIQLALIFSLVAAVLLYVFRFQIAALVTDDARVVAISAGLMVFIACYLVFDAFQTLACFVLRAYKVSFLPLCVHLVIFWGVGLGLGYWLAFYAPAPLMPQGAAGFWEAAALAIVLSSVLLGGLLLWVVRQRRCAFRRPTVKTR